MRAVLLVAVFAVAPTSACADFSGRVVKVSGSGMSGSGMSHTVGHLYRAPVTLI